MEDLQGCTIHETNPQTALLRALLHSDYDKFCELLETTRADPSYRHGKPHFSTYLEVACRHPEIPTSFIRKLLASGVKPNVNVVIPEPIHHAARSGHAAALHILLSNPSTRVNATDSSGHTALHYVVLGFNDEVLPNRTSGYQSCIEMLMQCSRFDINAIDNNGVSALHLAANKRRRNAACTIIEKARAAHRCLDLDTHLAGGRTTREALEAELPDVSLILAVEASSIPAGKKRLLQAMETGDFTLYQRLLRRASMKDDFDVDFWFEQPYNTRLLERACCHHNFYLSAKFVKVTLDAGAHPSSINLCTLRTPLHVAAEVHNYSAMKLLLEHPLVNVNVRDSNGQTPLHVAASCASSQNVLECLKLLLIAEGIDVNAIDALGRTPFNVAGCNAALKLIQDNGGEASKMPTNIGSRDATAQGENGDNEIVIGLIPAASNSLCDGDAHCTEMVSINPFVCEDIGVEKRLFQLMMQRCYEEFKKLLEETEFDQNFKYEEFSYTLLQYACESGLYKFAKKLLKKVDPNETHERNKRTPLMLACRQNDKKMVYILLHTKGVKEVDINIADHKKNTALHYAAINEDLDIISELLNHGANMFAKNMFGKYPLSADELRRLLDKSIDVPNTLPSNDNYAIFLKYTILLSQRETKTKLKYNNNHHHPLQYENSKDSLMLGLETHVACSEMNFLNLLTDSQDYTFLLRHPLITSFLQLKHDRMKIFLILNIVLCIVFVITLNAYIVTEVNKSYEDIRFVYIFKTCSRIIAFVCTICMLLRETAQLVLKTKLYVRNTENIFDLFLILVASLTLLQCYPSSLSQWVFTTAILLSWRNLFLVTGRHYKFSVNVQMLKAVSVNYLQLLKSYIFIIFGFSLSFYVVFSPSNHHHSVVLNQTDNTVGTDNSINYFENPLKTLLKTVTMMTGEFDANDLPYPTDIWLSSVVFVLFLFFLHVVLLNLLTALAVSDEQKITSNAKILSLISQIKLLHEIENATLFLYQLFRKYRCIARFFKNSLLFAGMPLDETYLIIWPNKGIVTRGTKDKFGEQEELINGFDSETVNEVKCFVMSHSSLSVENTSDRDKTEALMHHIERIERYLEMLLGEQKGQNKVKEGGH